MQTIPILKFIDPEAVRRSNHCATLWGLYFGEGGWSGTLGGIAVLDGDTLILTNHGGLIEVFRKS